MGRDTVQGSWKWDMNRNGVGSNGELYLIGGKIVTWGRHMEN